MVGFNPLFDPQCTSTTTDDLFHMICFKSGLNFKGLAQKLEDFPHLLLLRISNLKSGIHFFTIFSICFIFFFTSAKLRPRNSMRTLPTSSTSSISNFFEAAKSSTSSSESEHEKPSRSSIRPGMLMFGLEKNVGDPTRNFFCAIPVPQSRRSPAKN